MAEASEEIVGSVGRKLSLIELVTSRFENAARAKQVRVQLDFSGLSQLLDRCSDIFSRLDRDDDEQRAILRAVWLARSTILQTMLPLGEQELGLTEAAATLEAAADKFSVIRSELEELAQRVRVLCRDGKNPKREWLVAASQQHGLEVAYPVGVLAALTAGRTPGWPLGLTGAQIGDAGACLIRSRRDLQHAALGRLIVPGSLRFAPRALAYMALYGGVAEEIVFLSYRHEPKFLPHPLGLPHGCVVKGLDRPAMSHETVASADAPPHHEDNSIDTWAQKAFWKAVRDRAGSLSPSSEQDVLTPARFVLFGDGSGAYLPEQGSVVELSRLIDSKQGLDDEGERLPRKGCAELAEGDIVMLRLSGGGNYLEDVAQSIMAKEGGARLRARATSWKTWLHTMIKQHGEGIIARALEHEGVRVRSPSYLWAWAGEDVIGPHDLQTFKALIAVLCKLEPSHLEGDGATFAEERWAEMEALKSFHKKAGREIRRALLREVRRLIEEHGAVAERVSIELGDVGARGMGLFRVAAVDFMMVSVPRSRLFHVIPIGDV